jgi:hypothetical protein
VAADRDLHGTIAPSRDAESLESPPSSRNSVGQHGRPPRRAGPVAPTRARPVPREQVDRPIGAIGEDASVLARPHRDHNSPRSSSRGRRRFALRGRVPHGLARGARGGSHGAARATTAS